MGDSAGAFRSNKAIIAARAKASSWAKGDNWRETRGGFNPDVFKDLDSDTRERLRKHKVGPPKMRGDKDLGVGDLFTVGQWSERGNYGPPLPYGLSQLWTGSELGQHGTNRGEVQNAVWEMGLSGIETKEDLNRFLDRTEALKAEHGDFDWGPKATMLFRGQPVTEESIETTPPPEPEPEPEPQSSQGSTDTRNRWDPRGIGSGSIHHDPTSGIGPGAVDSVAAAANYQDQDPNGYQKRFIPQLNLQLESLKRRAADSRYLDRSEGKVPELVSNDIKDLLKYYSDKNTV